jgi:hypothetical protein
MAGKAKYILTVSMDVDADKEAIFNEVYDTEHIPMMREVKGVVSAHRYKMEPLKMALGGEVKSIVMEGEPTYMARRSADRGPRRSTPAAGPACAFTKNRRHVLRKPTGFRPRPPCRRRAGDPLDPDPLPVP